MDTMRKVLALGMVGCVLGCLWTSEALLLAAGADPRDPAETKRQVTLLGVGARVEVRLKHGDPVKGTIETIEEEQFKLATSRATTPRQIPYSEVTQLRGLETDYKSSAQPDPEQVRRVVAGLGKGKFINVRLTGGSSFDGRIRTIEEDHFTVSASKHAEPTKIAYAEVTKVKGKMTPRGKIALFGGIAGVALAILIPLSVYIANE